MNPEPFFSFFSKIFGGYKESKRFESEERDKERRYNTDRQKEAQMENANLRTVTAYKALGVFSEKVIEKFFGIHQKTVDEKDKHHEEVAELYKEKIDEKDNHHVEVVSLQQKIAAEKDNRRIDAAELSRQIVNVKDDHHSEVIRLYKDGIGFSLSLLRLIFEQKDELLEKTLCIIDEVSSNGENSFNSFEKCTQTAKILDDGLQLLSDHHCKVRDELLILKHDLDNLRSQFDEEEGGYNKIIELRCKLGEEEYKYQLYKSLLSSLEIADKINKYEISLTEKEHDKACIEEKLLFVNHIRESVEHKRYRELYAFKSSLNEAKTVAQIALPYQNDIAHKQLPLLSTDGGGL